jgi:hypothetical protein
MGFRLKGFLVVLVILVIWSSGVLAVELFSDDFSVSDQGMDGYNGWGCFSSANIRNESVFMRRSAGIDGICFHNLSSSGFVADLDADFLNVTFRVGHVDQWVTVYFCDSFMNNSYEGGLTCWANGWEGIFLAWSYNCQFSWSYFFNRSSTELAYFSGCEKKTQLVDNDTVTFKLWNDGSIAWVNVFRNNTLAFNYSSFSNIRVPQVKSVSVSVWGAGSSNVWDNFVIFKSDVPVLASVSWDNLTPLNKSIIVDRVPFYFRLLGDFCRNCSLLVNKTVVSNYSVSYYNETHLSAFYRFDEGSGVSALDSSIFDNVGLIRHGVYSSSIAHNVTGGFSLFLNSSAFVNVSSDVHNGFNSPQGFSGGCWVNLTKNNGANRVLYSKGYVTASNSNYYFKVNGALNQTTFGLGNGTTNLAFSSANNVLVQGKWQHLFFTVNASNVCMFVNGNKKTCSANTIKYKDNGKPLLIGRRLGSAESLLGKIDDCVLFNKSLNFNQVKNIYDHGVNIGSYEVFNFTQGFVSLANVSVLPNVLSNFSGYGLASGSYKFFVSCEGINSSLKFIVLNGSLPKVNFLQVQTPLGSYALFNGVVLEFENLPYNFTVNVSHADSFSFQLWNNSKEILRVNNSEVLTVNGNLFNNFVSQNPYVLKVSAKNYFGVNNFSLAFYLNDTILPICTGLSNSDVVFGNFYNWSVFCQDEFFYSFNLSCSNGFDYFESDINNYFYNFSDATFVNISDVLCSYEYCDGHTKESIEPMRVTANKNISELVFDSVSIKADKKVKDFSYKKLSDRYSFCFNFVGKENYVEFDIPEGCVPVKSQFSGHLVCFDSRRWIDFSGEDSVLTDYERNKVVVQSKKAKNQFCFESIGVLNCVSGVQKLSAVPLPPRFQIVREFDSVSQSIIYILLLLFWVILLLATLVLKGRNNSTIQLLNIFQCSVGFVAGFEWLYFSGLIGFVVMFVAIGVLIGKIVYND